MYFLLYIYFLFLFLFFLLSILCGPGTHYESCADLNLCKPPKPYRCEVLCRYFQNWTQTSFVRNIMDSVLGAWQSYPPQSHWKKIHCKYVQMPLLLVKQYLHCYRFFYLGYYFVFSYKYEKDVMFLSSERLNT